MNRLRKRIIERVDIVVREECLGALSYVEADLAGDPLRGYEGENKKRGYDELHFSKEIL